MMGASKLRHQVVILLERLTHVAIIDKVELLLAQLVRGSALCPDFVPLILNSR